MEGNSVPILEPKDGQEFIEITCNWFRKLPTNEQLQVVATLLQIMATKASDITISGDFIQYCMRAMSWLKKNKRSNVLYNFAKGLGTMREDKSDSLFPVKRMPMGLIEHTFNFFISMVTTLMFCI